MEEEISKKEIEKIIEESKLTEDELEALDFFLFGKENKEIEEFKNFFKGGKMEKIFIFIFISLIFLGCAGHNTIKIGGTIYDADTGNTYTGEIEYGWNQIKSIAEDLPILTEIETNKNAVVLPVEVIEKGFEEAYEKELKISEEARKISTKNGVYLPRKEDFTIKDKLFYLLKWKGKK